MAKTVATILGAAFVLVGIVGFIAPGLLGYHLSAAHNIVHLVSGAAALYFGLAGSMASARLFDIVFGAVYGLLGIVGFIAGSEQTAGVPGHSPDPNLWRFIPGVLELGRMDHILHIILAIVFLAGGLLTRTGDVVNRVEVNRT
jgi:hypothetical protein